MSRVDMKAADVTHAVPGRSKSIVPGSPMVRGKSGVGGRSKSIRKGGQEEGDASNTVDVLEQLNTAMLARLKDQLEQLTHRLENEGKKVAENAAKIEQLENDLRENEQVNIKEGVIHEEAVVIEMAKLEELQSQLGEAMRESDELSSHVAETVNGSELKKRSNGLRMEQLVNFVLSSTSNDLAITAEEIDRDVTGERIRALAMYEEEAHEGRALRVTFQRRRELWENYENLWLRESDPCFKPKYSNPNTSYHTMLDPHRCRWNTCVLDRCASEYMTTRVAAMAATEGPTMGGALMAARAAKKFASHRRTPVSTPRAPLAQDVDEEHLFPKASRR
ncbi:Hypothetical protein, putative [Bodo saltans]|uniref:Uncharacterized protein n=1 Tax=Bodo saltans TaxID=75058 RepID=A0A0S4IQ01_BODSA|nr:Hypothetical protein, putative [Bodo saltans]|eukprot:CUF08971.1 Hypothetical protein, putative [Bodo saltans]